jgi:hypothetical protein
MLAFRDAPLQQLESTDWCRMCLRGGLLRHRRTEHPGIGDQARMAVRLAARSLALVTSVGLNHARARTAVNCGQEVRSWSYCVSRIGGADRFGGAETLVVKKVTGVGAQDQLLLALPPSYNHVTVFWSISFSKSCVNLDKLAFSIVQRLE